MNKQQLANKIWKSANKMRSKIEANEYKDYILGFIFYKFLSDREEKYLLETLGFEKNDLPTIENEPKVVTDVQLNLGYFISYDNFFSTWIAKGGKFAVDNVTDALSAFERNINNDHRKLFAKIFNTLSVGLSKLGDTSGAQTKAIRELIYLIKDIPMDDKQDYDVLGFIYEYLISNFAANAGKKAGEFYTPHEVSLLMSEIIAEHLKENNEIEIYDPTSGSGSLLINIGKSVSRYLSGTNKIKYYAQELKENTYNLTRMNLIMRGIVPDNIFTRCGDTLEEDWPFFDENDPQGTYRPLYVDAVVSNPPYSLHWDAAKQKRSDARFQEYGLAPKTKADYAFLLHNLFHIKPNGIMCIVLPHGVLFRGGEEGVIRERLVEKNRIDAIIGLPPNLFFGTPIPTIVMVLKQEKDNTDILFVDASKHFEKVGKNNRLRASDIKRITDAVSGRKTIARYATLVDRETIRNNEYNLNIPRYVDSSEPVESWDIYATMFGGIPKAEADAFASFWEAFPTLRQSLFKALDEPFTEFATDDIQASVANHPDVAKFTSAYAGKFADFEAFLKAEVLEKALDINVTQTKASLTENLFARLADFPLVDPYLAYQGFHDIWLTIATDLEILQTENVDAMRVVDPNMVIKKKGEEEVEVQDGWRGRLLPFELVQQSMFPDNLKKVADLENRLAEITSEVASLADELSAEDKEADFYNSEKEKFNAKELAQAVKADIYEPDVMKVLKTVNKLLQEEKKVKKEAKDLKNALVMDTKAAIERMPDEKGWELLHQKWITPIVNGIFVMPQNVINDFVAKLVALSQKYETTFAHVEEEIGASSTALAGMIDELTGNEFDMQGLREFQKLLGGK